MRGQASDAIVVLGHPQGGRPAHGFVRLHKEELERASLRQATTTGSGKSGGMGAGRGGSGVDTAVDDNIIVMADCVARFRPARLQLYI